jgi:hypothetical protein
MQYYSPYRSTNRLDDVLMSERFGYRSALYLSALIALVHGAFFIYLLAYSSRLANGAAIYLVAALVVFVGLWLLSKIARYAGAAFYILSAGAAAFPLVISFKALVISAALLWSVSMGALSLAGALILIFSKSFSKEFAAACEKRPVYKKYLLNAFMILIALSAIAATGNDIVDLASR